MFRLLWQIRRTSHTVLVEKSLIDCIRKCKPTCLVGFAELGRFPRGEEGLACACNIIHMFVACCTAWVVNVQELFVHPDQQETLPLLDMELPDQVTWMKHIFINMYL